LSERRLPGKRPQKVPPSCVIIDTQSVKNAATATGATVGFDAGKLVKGRKRLVLVDTLGNVLASRVVPAHVSDAAAAITFWDEVAATHPLLGQVQVVMGDNSFAGLFAEHLARHYGVRFEKPVHIVLKKKNFCIHQKRWLVERTLAWLSANRRLSKEYDRLLKRANAWIMWANIRRILKFC
jgi:transposase